jgi:hypothetical protein
MHSGLRILAATAALALAAAPAHAAVTISTGATQNMSCSGGVCAPTAKGAVLNVGDLETLLAIGNVTVTTTGTGVQAADINIRASVTWSSGSVLGLDANRSIAIDQPVSVTGTGGLTIATGGKNGAFFFGSKGNITFANLSSALSINGTSYTLVGDIKTLASDIARNPSANVALAESYNASADGTYRSAPIKEFKGSFEGLGNVISNLTIYHYAGKRVELGLFAYVSGTVRDIGLTNVNVTGGNPRPDNYEYTGALVGLNDGMISHSYATGTVQVGSAQLAGSSLLAGGLVGVNSGTINQCFSNDNVQAGYGYGVLVVGGLVGYNSNGSITQSYARGTVAADSTAVIGGLAGESSGIISDSYSSGLLTASYNVELGGFIGINTETGTVTNSYAAGAETGSGPVGGFVGSNDGMIENSYATGSPTGTDSNYAVELGGFAGYNDGMIEYSYSTGAPSGVDSYVGGFIGFDQAPAGSLREVYWDTDTSGITNLGQGAGNIANDPGISGLTTAQFQSGLPAGFDPAVWAEKPNINGGLPYLLANRPSK